MITIIGMLSSIATLILFLVYLIGKYFSIKKQEVLLSETINVCYGSDATVKVRGSIDIGEDTSEEIYISSSEPLRYVRLCLYDVEKDLDKQNKSFEKEYSNLKNGQVLQVNTYLACGAPVYYVEYQRFDYVIGRFVLAENGKNGDLMEQLHIKHTRRSILYYLVN